MSARTRKIEPPRCQSSRGRASVEEPDRMTTRHYCPSCGAGLVSEPVGSPFRCKHCGWHLVSRAEWRKLAPFRQGYVFYMQASWWTSELKGERNPYAEGTAQWTAFREGEQRAMLDAQDGEE